MRVSLLPVLAAGLLLTSAATAQMQWHNMFVHGGVTVEVINGHPIMVVYAFDGGFSLEFRRPQPNTLRAEAVPTAIFGFDIGCGGVLKLANDEIELGGSGQAFPGDGWLWSPGGVLGNTWQRYLFFPTQAGTNVVTWSATFAKPGGGTSSPCLSHYGPQFVAVCFSIGQY